MTARVLLLATLLAGCAAVGEPAPVARPAAASPVERPAAANTAVADRRREDDRANQARIEEYRTRAELQRAESEAKLRDALAAQEARQKAIKEQRAAECRASRPARRRALSDELRTWQAFAARVGRHRQAILEQCRIGGATAVRRSVDERVECRGGGIPGGVSREDAVTSMQVDYEDPISIEADAPCSEVDSGDGEAPPKVTIADLLSGKSKP